MNVARLHIRPAEPQDAADILRLTGLIGGHDEEARHPGAEDRYLTTLRDPRARALVAEIAGRAMGYVELHARLSLFRGGREAWVAALVVDPTTRRSGVGAALLHAGDQAACLMGCSSIVLESSDWREDAHAFYRNQGFAELAPAARFQRPVGAGAVGEALEHQFLRSAARALSAVATAICAGHHPEEGVGADGALTMGPDWSAENAALCCLGCLGVPIISEESGPIDGRLPERGEPWITLDPLDGSRNHRAGLPPWSTAIGLVRDGIPIAGAVAEHFSGRRWWALDGEGAWVDGRPAKPKRSDLAIVPSPEPGNLTRVVPGYSRIRISGSTAADLCRVADGSAAAFDGRERGVVHPHDLAGPAAIIIEAGGSVIDTDEKMPAISTDPRRTYRLVAAYSHDEAARLINPSPAPAGYPLMARK